MGNHRVGVHILRPRSLFLRLMNCWFCTRPGFHVKYIRHCHPWFMAVLIKSSCCSGVHETSSCSLAVSLAISPSLSLSLTIYIYTHHANLNKYIPYIPRIYTYRRPFQESGMRFNILPVSTSFSFRYTRTTVYVKTTFYGCELVGVCTK